MNIEQEVLRLKEDSKKLMEILQNMQDHISELEQEIKSVPRAGRPIVYDTKFRNQVREYYNAGHTYRDTAAHFNISQPTICKILREYCAAQ